MHLWFGRTASGTAAHRGRSFNLQARERDNSTRTVQRQATSADEPTQRDPDQSQVRIRAKSHPPTRNLHASPSEVGLTVAQHADALRGTGSQLSGCRRTTRRVVETHYVEKPLLNDGNLTPNDSMVVPCVGEGERTISEMRKEATDRTQVG